MSTQLILIIILTILVVVSVFININLLRKVEGYEDVLEYQSNYIRNVSLIINESNTRLNESNLRMSFESDDEIGWFFNNIKEIQETLDGYNLLEAYGKEEK